MKMTCEDRKTIVEMTNGTEYVEPCDPCLLKYSFPSYIILQTIEIFRILDSEPSYGSPCETPQEVLE